MYLVRIVLKHTQLLAAVFSTLVIVGAFIQLTARQHYRDTDALPTYRKREVDDAPCDNIQRRRHLRRVCDELHVPHVDLDKPGTYSRILVDDEHKVLFCVVGKAGCTSWKTTLVKHLNRTRQLNLTDEAITRGVFLRSFLEKFGLVFMNTLPIGEIKLRVENYFKFMVVRHPFDRLISAYNDKMIDNNYKDRRFPKYIINKYGTISQKEHIDSENPTFAQFLRYVYRDSLDERDMHWQTYISTCHPCSIRYDYIARTETMDHDAPRIMRRFLPSSSHFPRLNTNDRPNRTTTLHEFRDIDDSTMEQLYKFYKTDFELFGYGYDIKTRDAVCEIPKSTWGSCC